MTKRRYVASWDENALGGDKQKLEVVKVKVWRFVCDILQFHFSDSFLIKNVSTFFIFFGETFSPETS